MLEEIKQKYSGLQLQNENVYMATKFADFVQMAVRKLRGEDKEEELVIDYVRPFILLSLLTLVFWKDRQCIFLDCLLLVEIQVFGHANYL